MSENSFSIRHFDHVELYVPEQYEAAQWYQRVFGFQIVKAYEFWAEEGGPLMVGDETGLTKLALFKGEPPGFREPIGFRRVAFRVDGQAFLYFLEQVKENPVFDHAGSPTTSLDVIDHDLSYSVYFCDPYGNRFEVTTYDYDFISQRLPPA